MHQPIIRYEHEFLTLRDDIRFTEIHLNALIALNNSGKNKYFFIIPEGVQFKQYVGVIQINGLTIEIRPKADRQNDDSTKKKWRDVLIQMLQACGKVKINPFEEAHLEQGGLNLIELYFNQYLNEVQSLIRNGLVKKYRKEEGNVKALKGKLDFSKNIRHNLVHKERFYTVHQVYDVNHEIHQILAQALEIVGQFSTSMSINDKYRRTQLDFPDVERIQATKQLLDSIQLNRKTAPYERALELARLIILNYSPNVSSGAEKMISILFDMNKLWEEYVLARLRKSGVNGVQILGKRSKRFWGGNSLEPDIVLKKDGKTYIIDTKWKISDNTTSIQDLRQMYAYGRFWNAEKIMLLYPSGIGASDFVEFENDDYISSSKNSSEPTALRHKCKKGVVSVLKTDNDGISKLDDNLGEKVLRVFGLIQ